VLPQPLGTPSLESLVPSTSAECGSALSPRRFSARGDQSSSQSPSACLLAFSSHGDTAGVSPTIWHRGDIDDLDRFDSFRAFRQQRRAGEESATDATPETVSVEETPDAVLEKAHEALNNELAAQLLDEIADRTPAFFEKIVLDLMKAMGYGGWGEAAGRLTGAGADEGIDGLIHEDRLGLETIYLQAKRWAGSVGRPDIHKFVGALHGRRARKGVFMTTSTFTRQAIDYAGQIDTKIVLVDGRTLARLMILHDVGCSPAQTYVVKKLDSDYFMED
jgi:restriction system protein